MRDLLLQKLITKKKVTKEDIYNYLENICENTHSSCDWSCPVFELNDGAIPDTIKDFKINRGCDCFKDGKKMFAFINNKI